MTRPLRPSDALRNTTRCVRVACWMLGVAIACLAGRWMAEAAISKGAKQRLEVGDTNQGGGLATSSKFIQRVTLGGGVASNQVSSSRFRLTPGFLAAALSTTTPVPVNQLNLTVLTAKTDPFGTTILEKTWQRDRDPIFLWEPPAIGLNVAGYSYAIDAQPDNTVDTASTSFDVAQSALKTLPEGKHTFWVKAINTAGNAGKAVSFEIWIDSTPPQITAYTPPQPGQLLNTITPSVSATVTDVGSGVTKSTVGLFVNGSPASIQFNDATGAITSSGGAWREGANSIELRVADAVGNAQTPLVWSVTIDTKPPTGSVVINGDAAMTTSVYVTLTLNASDATSGVARMLLSNDETSGYVEEPYVAVRELWKLNAVRGKQRVFVKFVDKAGNISAPVSDEIDLALLAPETVITAGPAGFVPNHAATFTFMCPEGNCVYSYAFDNEAWSDWNASTTATKTDLTFGNHYFRVKAALEVNGKPGIQLDEEDPTPAERTWIVGVEPSALAVPKGPPIKLWRME